MNGRQPANRNRRRSRSRFRSRSRGAAFRIGAQPWASFTTNYDSSQKESDGDMSVESVAEVPQEQKAVEWHAPMVYPQKAENVNDMAVVAFSSVTAPQKPRDQEMTELAPNIALSKAWKDMDPLPPRMSLPASMLPKMSKITRECTKPEVVDKQMVAEAKHQLNVANINTMANGGSPVSEDDSTLKEVVVAPPRFPSWKREIEPMENKSRKMDKVPECCEQPSSYVTATVRSPTPVLTEPMEPMELSQVEHERERNPLVSAAKQLKFCVQLAHGSPTAIISHFTTVQQLLQMISDAFDIKPKDILFCTVNTFKVNMESLFAGSLQLTDMLFVHVRGQPVEVEITKNQSSFGVTISDNGYRGSFIKRILDGSLASTAKPVLEVGQLLEKIGDTDVTDLRHFEVARALRNIPIGTKIKLRLVSPLKSGFSFLQPRNAPKKDSGKVGTGLETVRFRVDGSVVIEQMKEQADSGLIQAVNNIFEEYLSIQDDELARAVWDASKKCKSPIEMSDAIKNSDLAMFGFPDALVFDMWGLITDWRRNNEQKADSPNGLAVERSMINQ